MYTITANALRLATVSVLILPLASCATDDTWDTGRDRADVPRSDRYDRYDQTPTVPRAANAVFGSPDHFFLMQAQHINEAEIQLARIADQRTDSSAVRNYARMMIEDHQRLQEDTQQIVRERNFSIPQRPAQARQMYQQHLQALTGRTFDEEFLTIMIADHARAIALFESKLNLTTDSTIRNMAEEALPILQRHYDEAVSLLESS